MGELGVARWAGAVLAGAGIAVAAAGCGSPGAPDASAEVAPATTAALARPAVTAADVEGARERWAASGPETYRWRVRHECFCTGATLDIWVDEGEITKVGIVDPGRNPYPQEVAEIDSLTVELLFERLLLVLRTGGRVEASFDPVDGRPVSAFFDGGGGGDTYDTVELEVLPPGQPATTVPAARASSGRR